METLFVGLLLAAVSAITYIAYKHPTGYKKLWYVASWVLVVSLAVAGIWDSSMSYTYVSLIDGLEYEQRKNIDEKLKEIDLPLMKIFLVTSACYAYLLFLKYLPNILEPNDE